MKSTAGKILIWFVALTMLISSVGVAQVTHICKLAMAGIEKNSCAGSDAETHACCEQMDPVEDSRTTDESCCTDEVRYFQNSIDGTLQESLKSFQVQALFVTLLFNPFLLKVIPETILHFEEFCQEYFYTGKQTIVFIQSFLI